MIHLTSQPLTPKEIIQHVFSPLIGVLCSPQADELCHKNNLSFVELLQPFSKLTTDGEWCLNCACFFLFLRENICIFMRQWFVYCVLWMQPIFEMQRVYQRRSKGFALISVMLTGVHRKLWSHGKCSPIRWHQHNPPKPNPYKLTVNTFDTFACNNISEFNHILPFSCTFRSNIHRYSNCWTMVRTMARNILIRSVTIGSRIHQTFSRQSDCAVDQWSKHIGNGSSVNATCSNFAKCYTTKSAEMVYHWCFKLLRTTAWSHNSRQCDEVMMCEPNRWNLIVH